MTSYPQRILHQVIAENRTATRHELELIFQRNVVKNEVSGLVLGYFKDHHLKRLICLELYRINVIEEGKRKGRVVEVLSVVTGVAPSNVYRWINNHFGNQREIR